MSAFDLDHFMKGFQHDFDKRLEVQKAIYLLQESGADLGYHFSWYLRGPYSPTLADDAYSLLGVRMRRFLTDGKPIGQDVKEKFQNLMDIVKRKSTSTKEESRWLEILSSVHYVMRYSYPRPKTEDEGIDYIARLKGKRFSKPTIKESYEILQKVGLLK
jgi:uncharacterized protein YwgA